MKLLKWIEWLKRLASGSDDDNIIIYNKIIYQPDFIIKEHNGYMNCIIKLSSEYYLVVQMTKQLNYLK